MDRLIQTRATLLKRLKDLQDNTSWQDFFDTYSKFIFHFALKGGLSETEAQDVVQETMIAVAKNIPTFDYDPAIGSFKGWLLNMTRWRMRDQVRKRGPAGGHHSMHDSHPNHSSTVDKLMDVANPELEVLWETEWEKYILDLAISKVKRNSDPQKYQIFDLCVNKNWPAEKIAKTFGIPPSQVYMAKHRITALIKGEVQRLERRTA